MRPTELLENLIGVLTVTWRRRTDSPRGSAEDYWQSDRPRLASDGMVILHDNISGAGVRMIESLLECVNGRARHLGLGQFLVPECNGMTTDRFLNNRLNFLAVRHTICVC